MTEKLKEQLKALEFDADLVQKYLDAQPGADYVRAYQRRYFDGGYIFYRLDLDKSQERSYEVKGFFAVKVETPQFDHEVFNGIDSALLEERIRQVNWDYATVNVSLEKETIRSIFNDLQKLENSGSDLAAGIAAKLRSFYTNMVFWHERLGHGYYFELQGAIAAFTATDAYHLHFGRAVIKRLNLEVVPFDHNAYWFQLEGGVLKKYENFPLATLLKVEHIHEMQTPKTSQHLYKQLLQGERAKVHLPLKDGTLLPAGIEVDPEILGFRFYDDKGNQIRWNSQLKQVFEMATSKQVKQKRSSYKRRPGAI